MNQPTRVVTLPIHNRFYILLDWLEHNIFGSTTFKVISNGCIKHQLAVKFFVCIYISDHLIWLFILKNLKNFIAVSTSIIMCVYCILHFWESIPYWWYISLIVLYSLLDITIIERYINSLQCTLLLPNNTELNLRSKWDSFSLFCCIREFSKVLKYN